METRKGAPRKGSVHAKAIHIKCIEPEIIEYLDRMAKKASKPGQAISRSDVIRNILWRASIEAQP